MKNLGSYCGHTWSSGALMALCFIGFLASRPPESPFKLMVFFLSLAGLLAGGVLIAGALMQATAGACGFDGVVSARIIRHLVGVCFSASAMYVLGLAACLLSLITWDPDGMSDFSEFQRALSALGWRAFSIFMWPAQVLRRLGGDGFSGWSAWLISSLFYGVFLYVSIIVLRHLVRRASGGHTTEQNAPDGKRAARLDPQC